MPKLNECWEPTEAEREEIEARKAEVRADAMARDMARVGGSDRSDRLGIGPPSASRCRQGKLSRFRGVSGYRYGSKFRARMHVRGRQVDLGLFATEEDAARAYDRAARPLGKKLNFPDEA